MRVVVFSDIHGNVVALEAVLEAIRQEAAPDVLFIAGDLALLGPRPAESLALLRSLDGARFVMGNTDKYILDRTVHADEIDFTRSLLSLDDLSFMGALPFEQRLEVAPDHELLVVHANPRDLEEPIKPGSPEAVIRPLFEGVTAEIVAFGHYHVPFVRQFDGRLLVDVASVGMPRDNDQRAVYAILTWDGRMWHVEHRRVPFDIEYVARDYVTVGYPNAEEAAQRLLAARY